VRALLAEVTTRRGHVPPMVRILANSPSVLRGFLDLGDCLRGGLLTEALRERIAISVAAANRCAPCLTIHSGLARTAGVPETEVLLARDARSDDATIAAALRFALAVMAQVGHVSDQALREVREAGFDDAAIVEITVVVFINVFTNAINHLGTAVEAEDRV
jgi:uncharacterized peroxidase-related enzyme